MNKKFRLDWVLLPLVTDVKFMAKVLNVNMIFMYIFTSSNFI